MIFDNLVNYFDKNLQESTNQKGFSKEVLELIKKWEADPVAQERWNATRKNAAKIKNSPGWRTHPKEYMQENFKSVSEIYQDLKEANIEEVRVSLSQFMKEDSNGN